MKTINQSITKRLILLMMIALMTSSLNIYSQATPIFPNPVGVPELLSGTDLQVGARYLYRDVQINVNGSGSNADALLTIVALSDITVNTVDSTLGVENRFEPSTTTTAIDGFVEWELIFVQSGTANAVSNGVPIPLDSFTLEAIDVDGEEFFEVVVPNSYTLENNTELVVSTNGNFTRFQSGTNFAAGIDVANTEFIVAVTYTGVSTVRFRNGRSVSGGLRQNSVSFLGEVVFSNPNTIIVNNPPVVVDNLNNTVLQNSTNNTPFNILLGTSDPENNIDINTIVLIDPNDVSNIGMVGTPLVINGVGTYSVDASGDVVFTPALNYVGNANVNFRVEDTLGATSNTSLLEVLVLANTDSDGVDDITDLDDDNDGILDIVESLGNNPDGDEDGDGIPNFQDVVDDGTGDGSATDYTDANNDSIPDVYDFDEDGVPNHLDLDSDNDGIYDVVETGNDTLDADDDGQIDGAVGTNGIPDAAEDGGVDGAGVTTSPINTDLDPVDGPNFLDNDSDNDGCVDAIEAEHSDADNDTFLGVSPIVVDTNGLVTGQGGYTGTNVNVTTATQVVITTDPVDEVIIAGNNANFNIIATASSTTTFNNGIPDFNIPPAIDVSSSLTYQWQVNTGSGFVDLVGEVNPTLTLTNVPATDNGNIYRVVVSHPDNLCVVEQRDAVLTVESPGLDAQKVATINDGGDGIINEGDTITYDITITNTGNVALNNLILFDIFQRFDGTILTLNNLTFVSADQGSAEGDLLVGETAIYTAIYTVTQADIDAGGVINRLTVMGDTPGGIMVNDTADDGDDADGDIDDDPTVTVIPPVPELTFTKTGVLSGIGEAGDSIDYTFTVENTGNLTIDTITIDDPLTGSTSLAVVPSPLAPGEIGTATASYIVTQADVDRGFVENSATVNGIDPDGNDVTDISDAGDEGVETPDGNGNTDGDPTNDPTVIIITQTPELTFIKTGSVGGQGAVGDLITYTFTVENTGNVTIDNVLVTDPLTGTNNVSTTPSTLAPGEIGTATGTYTITQADLDAGFVENSASVVGQDPNNNDVNDISDAGDEGVETPDGNGNTDGDPTNDPTVVILIQTPELTLTKTANVAGTGMVGDVITYTFTIENTGNITINNISVEDILTNSTGANILIPTPNTLASGDIVTVTAMYTVTQADVDAGFVENSATVSGQDINGNDVTDISDAGDEAIETPDGNGNTDGNPTNDPTVVVLMQNPELTLTKVGSINGTGFAGETIDYTFTVENTGDVTINNVTINDPLTGSTGTNVLIVTPSSLAPGEIGIATASYTITQEDINAGFVENSATVTGQDSINNDVTDVSDAGDESVETPDGNGNTDGDPTNDPTVITINPIPQLTLTKTAQVIRSGALGDDIIYTFTVQNTGNITIDNITIDDVLIGSTGVNVLALTPIALNPGETGSVTATYIITQADLDRGFVQNSATATGQDGDGNNVTDVSDAGDETIETPDGNDNTDGDPTNDPTVLILTQNGQLTLTKTGSVGGAGLPGDIITYTFTVQNTGNLTIDDVIIDDPLTGSTGTNVLMITPNPLLPTQTGVVTATYTITQADIDRGFVENSAIASGLDPRGNNVTDISDAGDENIETPDGNGNVNGNTTDDPTVIIVPLTPNIEAEKIASIIDNGDGELGSGDIINYTILITNTGDVTLTNVTLIDTLTDIDGNPLTLDSGPVFDNADLGSSEGTLLSGEIATYIASYTITQSDVDVGGVRNSVTVNADNPVNPVNDISDDGDDTDGNTEDDPTETFIIATPQLTLTKTGSVNGIGTVGDEITYTFSVLNTGNVTINAITIEDALTNTSGLAITPNSLAPGETGIATAVYTITQNDVDVRFVENSATTNGIDPDANPVTDISDAGNETVETPDSNGNTDGDPTNDPTVITLSPQDAGIVIFDGISPNGDGSNDTFFVEGLQNFPNNNVRIFNRWGVEVFNQSRYHLGPFFDGRSDGRATFQRNEELPAGVYYYVVTYEIDGRTMSQAGPLYITR